MKHLYDMNTILFFMLKEGNNEFTKNIAKSYLCATDTRRSDILKFYKDVFDYWKDIIDQRKKEI